MSNFSWRLIPWGVVFIVIALSAISVINLHSTGIGTDSQVHVTQLIWLAAGSVLMFIVAMIDVRIIRQLIPTFYVMVIIALALVLVIGKEVNGSRRWLDLGFAGFQPSELAKLAVILSLAGWFHRVARPDGYGLGDLVPVAVLLGVPMFLVLKEPDLGHTLMLLFIGGTMVIFEKLQRRAFISIVLTALLIAPGLWTFVLHDYQKNRILTLLDSDGDKLRTGWHARQARIAVGSGGLLGKGHGSGTQVAGEFLPENHTDFVFAHLSEEHGFVGGSTVLLLYFLLVLSSLRAAARARDRFAAGVAIGVGALIFWHVLMNIGMVLNILPVTGVTLPLLSYGGTSALTVMCAIGLLLNIEVRRSMFQSRLS
ncbi:MAG: rod shape-determining protein RodA [Myxococcota bacterium]|nr:rod shape-determining protein RodA [Myxococcota bacterium]